MSYLSLPGDIILIFFFLHAYLQPDKPKNIMLRYYYFYLKESFSWSNSTQDQMNILHYEEKEREIQINI